MIKLWLCDECGSPDAEVSAWIHANSGEVSDADGPASAPFCPVCACETRLSVLNVTGADEGAAMVHARRWSGAFGREY